jgi:2-polyprenyl-3-methyl-5-hydroxy-6-metoxy-1,4-benzoquinol methylase
VIQRPQVALRVKISDWLAGAADSNRQYADFPQADEQLEETLDELDATAPNYADWIGALAEPHLGPLVMEVGAGHGTIVDRIASGNRHVVATDLSPRCCELLRQRFGNRTNVEVVEAGILDAAHERLFDAVVLINVLEHIPGQDALLAEIFQVLKPGGRVIIYVPAFERLYSTFDHKIGHVRRYRRAELVGMLKSTGFAMDSARYVNLPGWFAWWLLVRVFNRAPTDGRAASHYDRLVIPITRRLETRWKPPFGQSLLCVARVP